MYSWKKIVSKLSTIVGIEANKEVVFSEAKMFNWGYAVYKKLWQKFKLNEILPELQTSNGKTKFNLNDACFLMAIQHLLSPSSKLCGYHSQGRYAKLPEVGLNHIYRSLDILSQCKKEIESHLFKMVGKNTKV